MGRGMEYSVGAPMKVAAHVADLLACACMNSIDLRDNHT
jgi:hypothetical protein